MRWFRRRRGDGDSFGTAPVYRVPSLAHQSPRELMQDWLRTLTIAGETGTSPQQKVDLIAEVNQPGTLTVAISTPLPAHDVAALNASLEWHRSAGSRQAGVNLLENLLIEWLIDATGQTRVQVIQRLALMIETIVPPD